jgi:hypothetical protein
MVDISHADQMSAAPLVLNFCKTDANLQQEGKFVRADRYLRADLHLNGGAYWCARLLFRVRGTELPHSNLRINSTSPRFTRVSEDVP